MSKYLEAKTVREFTNDQGEVQKTWTKCGVAFPFKQGVGYIVKLDALPVNGELVLSPPYDKDKAKKEGGGEKSDW